MTVCPRRTRSGLLPLAAAPLWGTLAANLPSDCGSIHEGHNQDITKAKNAVCLAARHNVGG